MMMMVMMMIIMERIRVVINKSRIKVTGISLLHKVYNIDHQGHPTTVSS